MALFVTAVALMVFGMLMLVFGLGTSIIWFGAIAAGCALFVVDHSRAQRHAS